MAATSEFRHEKHVKYFLRCLQVIPTRYASFDTTRMTIAFFGLSGLDILNALHTLKAQRQTIIEWIYRLQVLPNSDLDDYKKCGFRGSTTLIPVANDSIPISCKYDSAHVAMTYTALLSLLILGDGLQQVNRAAVVKAVRNLQCEDGSFSAMNEGSENDMRFVYCASCVCYMLDDWNGMDVVKTCSYIKQSLSYEGAFGQGPGLEAHGGSTFCAVASLHLMGRLTSILSVKEIERLRRWCLFRQLSGFQGRPNKPVDTCYSFWVGATLEILDCYKLSSLKANRTFLMTTQDNLVGGFAKWPDNGPDALHAYFGVCGMSLLGENKLEKINAALNVSQRAADNLARIHSYWRNKGSSSLSLINWCLSPTQDLHLALHVSYIVKTLSSLGSLQQADMIRISLVHFLLVSLDLLGSLNTINEQRENIINWIYAHQVLQPNKSESHLLYKGGFCGGSPLIGKEQPGPAHIVMTYSALCTLVTLGDDLSRVDRTVLLQAEQHVTQPLNGVVSRDIKIVYCALAIEYLLTNSCGTHINSNDVVQFLKMCKTYEGVFSQVPGSETHGGASYCAIACLGLLGRLDLEFNDRSLHQLIHWLIMRQSEIGVSSRCNKLTNDSSYIFWLIATMILLKKEHLLNKPLLRQCLLQLQCPSSGGFSPMPGHPPDAMHTYFALAALSLLGEPGLSLSHTLLTLKQKEF